MRAPSTGLLSLVSGMCYALFDHKRGVTKRISKEGATAWSGLTALFGEGCAAAPFPWSPRLLSALLHNDNNRVTGI